MMTVISRICKIIPMDIMLTEFRLQADGEVLEIMREASIDDQGVYHLLGKLVISENNLMDNVMFLKEDMGQVMTCVPYELKEGGIDYVNLDEPLILSDTDDTLMARLKFRQYLDKQIAAYAEQLKQFANIDDETYEKFINGTLDVDADGNLIEPKKDDGSTGGTPAETPES